MLNNELKNYCCTTSWDYNIKLSKDLPKNSQEMKTKKSDNYEKDGDGYVLKNTTLSIKHSYIVFGMENKAKYDTPTRLIMMLMKPETGDILTLDLTMGGLDLNQQSSI